MSRRSRLLAFGLAAAVISAAAYVFVVAQDAINELPKDNKPIKDKRRIVAVVDNKAAALKILELPNAVVIGTQGLDLKSKVSGRDQHRVLETETKDGWLDLAKHLRPQILAVLPEQLNQAKAENSTYVGSVVLINDLCSSS